MVAGTGHLCRRPHYFRRNVYPASPCREICDDGNFCALLRRTRLFVTPSGVQELRLTRCLRCWAGRPLRLKLNIRLGRLSRDCAKASSEKAFDRKDRRARPQRSRRQGCRDCQRRSLADFLTALPVVSRRSLRSEGLGRLLAHRPSQSVGLFSCGDLSDDFQRIQIHDRNLIIRTDGYVGA